MLQVRGLTKKFGKQIANRDIDLDCAAGEISVLLGPNGAGKSTAIKCILGLLRYEGEVKIGGYPARSDKARRILGYVPEFPALYGMLTMEEQFEFIIRAYSLDREEAQAYAEELIHRFRLTERRKYLCKNLSKGMQQKVSIICALLPKPKLLLLDEPMIGLDPHAIKELRDIVLNLARKGVAIVISTHMIASVEGIWNKAYILSRGRVISCHAKAQLQGMETASLEKIFFEETERPEVLTPKEETHELKKEKKHSAGSKEHLAKADKASAEHRKDTQKKSKQVQKEPSAFSQEEFVDPDLDPDFEPGMRPKPTALGKNTCKEPALTELPDMAPKPPEQSSKDSNRPAPPKMNKEKKRKNRK